MACFEDAPLFGPGVTDGRTLFAPGVTDGRRRGSLSFKYGQLFKYIQVLNCKIEKLIK